MRSAAAEIAGESLFDLFQSRMRRLGENGASGHDHAVGAITALRGLLGDESGLDRIRFIRRPKTFQSGNSAARDLFYRSQTRAHGLAFHQHRACAALPQPATELCAMQRQRVAQNVKKRLVRIPGIDGNRAAVDAELVLRHAIIIRQLPALE